MMKIGIQSLGSVDRTEGERPEKGFRAIRDAGFEAVDFNFESYVDFRYQYCSDGSCFFDKPMDELKDFFRPYKEACENAGLIFGQGHAMFGPFPETEEELQQFIKVQKNVIRLSGWMGVPYLVIHPWVIRRKVGRDAEFEKNMQYFRAFADTAKEEGVVICLENLFDWVSERAFEGPCADAVEAKMYLTKLNAEFPGQFKFCFDTGHANMMGKNIREFINVLGDDLAILHMHENDGVYDIHGIPFTYQRRWGGRTIEDWDGVIKGLADIGYDGVLNFETGPSFFTVPDKLYGAAARYMFEVGNYLRNEIISYRSTNEPR